jgi:parvulin-like peptidyl-prolyl isomerase
VLAQCLEAKLEKEQKDKIEEAIGKMFDEYVEKLKKDLKVGARAEVEQKLRTQGTSLVSLKVEFRYRLLADEYLRQKSKKPHVVGRQEVLAYYESHLADYSYPERVHWQLLEINFAKHGGQAKSLAALEQAIDALRRGENFAKVAKKYSDGPHAENGGQQSWTKPDSVADTKTAAVLHKLAPGEVSSVVHTADSYRLIRLNARKPAGRHALAEVQETIKRKIEERLQKEATKEVLIEVYQQASIESSFLPPEELGPPADFAGPSPATKNGSDSVKKRRDRS